MPFSIQYYCPLSSSKKSPEFTVLFICSFTFCWIHNTALILHLLPLIYPIFTCGDPDPYSEYGSTKFLHRDPIWIRIHNTAYTVPVKRPCRMAGCKMCLQLLGRLKHRVADVAGEQPLHRPPQQRLTDPLRLIAGDPVGLVHNCRRRIIIAVNQAELVVVVVVVLIVILLTGIGLLLNRGKGIKIFTLGLALSARFLFVLSTCATLNKICQLLNLINFLT